MKNDRSGESSPASASGLPGAIYMPPAVIYESEIEVHAGSMVIPTQSLSPIATSLPIPTPPISPLSPPEGD